MRAISHFLAAILLLGLTGCGAISMPTPGARESVAPRSAVAAVPFSQLPDQVVTLHRPARPSRGPLNYKVGVDYHAYGGDFDATSFITQYQLPEVRAAVQAQLQGMADAGATLMFTRIWFVTEPGTTDFGQKWRATFPMTDQEQANLRAYAQDVAAVKGQNGNRLRLDLCTLWLGAADFTRGTPETSLGFTPVTAAEFTRRVELTTDKLLAAVKDVVRPDGIPIVDSIFLEGEVMIGSRTNEQWFLLTHYPRFVQAVQAAGFKPSLYFLVGVSQATILQTDIVVNGYPILTGHGSMWWMYPGLKFLVDNHLYVPPRIDFSWYIADAAPGAPFDKLLKKVLDDADAVLPSIGVPTAYGLAETHYFGDPNERRAFGLAIIQEVTGNSRLERVQFWTTPNSDDPGGTGYPFAISDYLP